MKRLIFIIAALFATAQAQTIQTIGAPTTTVVSRGNFRTDSIFYLPKRQKLPTDSGAVRYQISDSSVYYWTGSQWRRLGVHIDTASMLNPYLRGSGTANYLPIFDASRSVINSKVYQTGTNLLFNTTTASFTSAGISTIEANNTSASVFALKVLDTTRSYIASNSSNTMDINNLRAGDIRFYTSATLRGRFQTDGTFRLNSLTGTGSRIVTADADGVLSATSSATGLVDTLVLSTRAWRQKGDDSLGAIIATKGSGTITSVATGYGLSGGTITTTGTISADTLQLSTRAWRQKGLDSLAALEISGSGTTNYVPKFTDTRTVGNSQIFDNGTNVGISSTSPNFKLDVNGTFNVRSNYAYFGSDANTAVYAGSFSNEGRIGVGGRSSFPTANLTFFTADGTNNFERMRITSSGEVLVNTVSDAGDYKLQVSGNIYGSGSASFGGAAYSGRALTAYANGTDYGMTLQQDNASGLGLQIFRNGASWGGTPFNIQTSSSTLFQVTTASEVLVNTTTDAGDYKLQVSGNAYVTGGAILAASSGNVGIGGTPSFNLDILTSQPEMRLNATTGTNYSLYRAQNSGGTLFIGLENSAGSGLSTGAAYSANIYHSGAYPIIFHTNSTQRMRITSDGELLIATTTDAGDYKLQVSGNAYVTGTTVLAASSGSVGIGTTSPSTKLHILGGANTALRVQTPSGIGLIQMQKDDGTANWNIEHGRVGSGFGIYQSGGTNGGNTQFYVAEGGYIGIGTTSPNASALVDITSTVRGFLPPRMTTTQRNAISSPAAGLVIYNTTDSKLQVYTTSWTDLH